MEKVHKPQSPAYFELVAGEMNFLCVNAALSGNERIVKSVHLARSYNGEMLLPYDEDKFKVEHLAIGESCTLIDKDFSRTIVVRIR